MRDSSSSPPGRARRLLAGPRALALAVVVTMAGGLAGCAGFAPAQKAGSGSADDAPAVTALSVTAGSVSGGTTVELAGTGLDHVTAVAFGDAPATLTAATDKKVTVTTTAATGFAAASVPVVVSAGKAAVAASDLTFDYQVLTPLDKQLSYVLAHWQQRNIAEYGSLVDNDCVNFASQSLIARGWTTDDTWWHTQANGVDKYSSTWISSTSLRRYLTAHPELVTHLTDDERDKVAVGDIVQFDWDNSGDRDHTGIVTRVTGSGDSIVISFAGHSLDSDYRSVDDAITIDHPGGTADYWHVLK